MAASEDDRIEIIDDDDDEEMPVTQTPQPNHGGKNRNYVMSSDSETEVIDLDDCDDDEDVPMPLVNQNSEIIDPGPSCSFHNSTVIEDLDVNKIEESASNDPETVEILDDDKDEVQVFEEIKTNQDNERKNISVYNQVQCVNLHCQSGYDLAEAPIFVLTYFKVERKKNILQKVCRECFYIALKHQEKLCTMLVNDVPLLSAEFPTQKDDVVVMDSVEETYQEKPLPPEVISLVEEELEGLLNKAVNQFDIDLQINKCQEILGKKYDELTVRNKQINEQMNSFERQMRTARNLIYRNFAPRIRSLPPLNIDSGVPETSGMTSRTRCVAVKKITQQKTSPIQKPLPIVRRSPSEVQLSPPGTSKSLPSSRMSLPVLPKSPPTIQKSLTLVRKSLPPMPKSPPAIQITIPSVLKPVPTVQRPHPPVQKPQIIQKVSTPIQRPQVIQRVPPSPVQRPQVIQKVPQPVQKPVSVIQKIPQNLESQNDVVAVKEVEVRKVQLPPIGTLVYPMLFVGSPVFVMKVSFFGAWVKGRIVEIFSREGQAAYRIRFNGGYKVASGKQIAYRKPSAVRYPVGTRVIALFKNSDSPFKDAFYAGVVAEPPKILNVFRYLVFFDDGYAQYVPHDSIFLVCAASKLVYEDIHPDSREFIRNYLNQYPERPMVKLQKGQALKTEWNGKWWVARVVEIDGSLVKMHFEADNRTEWIYRGSTRLGPLYSELVAAAARKEQGALSRHRSLGIASLKKRNMPYVEYSVDLDDSKSHQPAVPSKNVAKKSTCPKPNSVDQGISKGPPEADEKMEYTTRGYIKGTNISNRIKGRVFRPHQCGDSCISWTNYTPGVCKGTNPLALPLLYGFERQLVKTRTKKFFMYSTPCGRRIRNVVELHRYLRLTKSKMGLDLFAFDQCVHVLDEFHLEPSMYCTHIKDISYGQENTPVSCVNEINHSWPSFMNYSTRRIPQEGVNICLDEEFLVCCSCTDDCMNKEKCECWQLTIEGTKLAPGGKINPNVGYQFKRLPEPVPTGIYECNQRCKCASTCLNRVAQFPLQLNLQVFRTLKKGWGIRTINDIPQGGFICIYAGRLHTEQSANDDGRMYGDEYLAELDYIEVVERFKEGYESEIVEPGSEKTNGKNDSGSKSIEYKSDIDEEDDDELDESQMNSDDTEYIPQGLSRLPKTESIVNTRGRNKKINSTESEGEKEKEKEKEKNKESQKRRESTDDEGEMKKTPSKFTAEVAVVEDKPLRFKSVREYFGDGADDCYIMDAKSTGNIGRYLNHSCQPNVFVQNVFVDTHDVRFPWVAFFALSYIKAGTELTWDYNYDIGSVPGKVLYCYCNSAECRGRLL